MKKEFLIITLLISSLLPLGAFAYKYDDSFLICSASQAADIFCSTIQHLSKERRQKFDLILDRAQFLYSTYTHISRLQALQASVNFYESRSNFNELDWALIKFLTIVLTDCTDPSHCLLLWIKCIKCVRNSLS